jgi:hypothetical protein
MNEPIYVDSRNFKQFGFIKKLIESDADDYATLELSISKHDGVIVGITHTIKYSVKSRKDFDTKT